MGEWLDVFLKEYNRDVKEFTQKAYEVCCRCHLKPMLGRVKLTALTAPIIQDAYNAILEGKTSREPISPKTLKNCHGVLHKALKIAQKVGFIRSNPADAISLPHVEKPNINPLKDEDIARFLKAIKWHKYEDLFKVTLFTGMRQGEALGLTWDCVDFKNHTINIEKQLIREKKMGGKYKFAPLKNDKCRIEQLPDSIFDIFVKLHQLPTAQNEMNLVFVKEDGKHLSHCTVSKNFKAIVTELGLSEQRFHNLRHTFAVLSLQNGDSIKTVQENLGHATAAFTMQVYAHVSDKMKKESADKMQAYIDSIGNDVQG